MNYTAALEITYRASTRAPSLLDGADGAAPRLRNARPVPNLCSQGRQGRPHGATRAVPGSKPHRPHSHPPPQGSPPTTAPSPLRPLLPQDDANTIFSFLVAKALQVNKRLIFKFPITIETSAPPTASQGRVDNCSATQRAASSFPPLTWLRRSWIFIIYFIFSQRETTACGHSLFRAAEDNKHQAQAEQSPSDRGRAMSNFTARTRLPGERTSGTLALVLGRTQCSTTHVHFPNPVPPWGRG